VVICCQDTIKKLLQMTGWIELIDKNKKPRFCEAGQIKK